MRRRQSLSKCVALCAFIITHLAPGAAAAPIGTPRFIELVHEQKDSNAPDFYCVVGDSGARLATAVRGVLNLAATDTVKIATDLSVYKLNQIFQTTRSRSLARSRCLYFSRATRDALAHQNPLRAEPTRGAHRGARGELGPRHDRDGVGRRISDRLLARR